MLVAGGSGGQSPTSSLGCRLAPDGDDVAVIAPGVDVAGGDRAAVGLRAGLSAIPGCRIAAVAAGSTRPTGGGVVVATIGIGRCRAAIGTDGDRRLVGDRATVDGDVAALATLDRDLVARVATRVDVADADGAAVGIGRRGAAVPGCRVAAV